MNLSASIRDRCPMGQIHFSLHHCLDCAGLMYTLGLFITQWLQGPGPTQVSTILEEKGPFLPPLFQTPADSRTSHSWVGWEHELGTFFSELDLQRKSSKASILRTVLTDKAYKSAPVIGGVKAFWIFSFSLLQAGQTCATKIVQVWMRDPGMTQIRVSLGGQRIIAAIYLLQPLAESRVRLLLQESRERKWG